MVNKELFEKAAGYSDAALTFVDADGFPFSTPVSFEVDAQNQVVKIRKLKSLPSLQGRNVGVIFSYITPLPIGGYTDRRYIVLWGQINEDNETLVLRPTKGYTWNEKEVPFFQYCEVTLPRARSYLQRLGEKPWLSAPWLVLRTLRLPFLVATILPVALGALIAYRVGFFEWSLFALTMLGAVLFHLGMNTANDYFDHASGADDINTTPTPFSGGSRMIQYGLLSPFSVLSVSTAAYLGGAAIGLFLAFTRGLPILLIGLLGFLVSFTYTAPPLRLGYRGIGELAVAVGFGPLLVLGSYYVQTQTFALEPLLASIPVGLLVMLILYVNEIPDRTWDDEAGKRTLVARVREESLVPGYIGSVVAVYAVVFLGVIAQIFPATAILALLTIPMAVKVRRSIKANLGNPYGLMPAMSSNIKLYVYTTLLLLIGYFASGYLRL